MREKRCTKCGETYPDTLEYFHSRGNGKLDRYCKKCKVAANRKWRKENKDKIYTKNKTYSEDDLTGSMVESDGIEKVKVPCWTCGKQLTILWDTTSNRRMPKKLCYKCKDPAGHMKHEPDCGIIDNPSELPYMDH